MECPCKDCDIRGTEVCDHGVKCTRGFASWRLENAIKTAQRKTADRRERELKTIDVARGWSIYRKKKDRVR